MTKDTHSAKKSGLPLPLKILFCVITSYSIHYTKLYDIARSQLVEIGGGFRVPDVMKQSGAKLVEGDRALLAVSYNFV